MSNYIMNVIINILVLFMPFQIFQGSCCNFSKHKFFKPSSLLRIHHIKSLVLFSLLEKHGSSDDFSLVNPISCYVYKCCFQFQLCEKTKASYYCIIGVFFTVVASDPVTC